MKESEPLRAVRARMDANEAALRRLRAEREAIQRDLDAELVREQDRFAQAVMAKRDHGMTLAGIATAMDCSIGTVSRAIARWRQVEGLPRRPRKRTAVHRRS